MKKRFLIFLLHFVYSLVPAQSGDIAPVVYDQFFKNYFLLNPSVLNTNNKLDIALGNRTLTGLFEGVNRFYADLSVLSDGVKENRYHAFGLLAMNNRDGEYFSKSRLYARYSWCLNLTARSSISAGASLGFINYTFKSSPAGGGGSSFAPDANIGVWYISQRIKFGVSYQQITRPTVRPVNQQFVLGNYLNINFIHRSDLNENIYIESNLYYKYQPLFPFYFEAAPVLTLFEKVEAGVNYRYKRGLAVTAGLKRIAVRKNHFRFMASYLISTRRLSSINDGVLEFSFGYSLPK